MGGGERGDRAGGRETDRAGGRETDRVGGRETMTAQDDVSDFCYYQLT